MDYKITPIGVVHSCYKEKFGVPRQPGLVNLAQGMIELFPEYSSPEAVRGLESFSHIWVLYMFHRLVGKPWRPTVRPPRLGGNQRMGVFATRSPFRPNNIGMSVVKLGRIEVTNEKVCLHVSGLEMIEGTPVIDIKPYLGYVEAIADAQSGYATSEPEKKLKVEFSPLAQKQCEQRAKQYPGLIELIEQLLVLDPRPAYMGDNEEVKEYGMQLYNFDLKWQVNGDTVIVKDLKSLPS